MRRTTLHRELIATLAIPLAAALAPAPLAGQSTTRPAVVVEGFLSRARLDPSVGGSRMEVRGIGGRVLVALAPLQEVEESRGLARRLAVGAFAPYAPHDDGRFTAAHYGAVADYHLLGAPLAPSPSIIPYPSVASMRLSSTRPACAFSTRMPAPSPPPACGPRVQ